METISLDNLKYPVGKFSFPKEFSGADIKNGIQTIEALPAKITAAVQGLTDEQLDTSYREGGWSIRQVVHHLADSHMNAYIRFKLALTEDNPTIKPYKEAAWAELADSKLSVDSALSIIDGIHKKWTAILKNMKLDDYNLTFFHPEQKRSRTLHEMLALYEWHSRHHLAHITELKKRKSW